MLRGEIDFSWERLARKDDYAANTWHRKSYSSR